MSVEVKLLSVTSLLVFSSVAYAQTPLNSGLKPFFSPPLQSGIALPQQPQEPTSSPVVGQIFNSQGGVGRVPGSDNATQASNAANATNATGGRGFAARRR